jgi:hypothetical protein
LNGKIFVCQAEDDDLNPSVGISFHSNGENFDRHIENSQVEIIR